MPRGTTAKRRAVGLLFGLLFALLAILMLAPSSALAMPVQFFFVPFPEDQLLTMMTAVELGGPSNAPAEPITSYITITAVADGTIIYYDQWENGYDIDIANTYNIYTASNPGGTQIWGDGDSANGAPPGIPSDRIDAGTVIQLTNDVYTTTRQAVIDFDGGDKMAATKTIAITRSSWAAQTGTLFAGCVEVFDTNNWGTDYRAPVGTNLADNVDYQMFEYTALSIMAGQDGAVVSVDANNDGDYLDAGELNGVSMAQGESRLVTNVYYGAHVVSSRPVQVDIYTGDVASNYESRDSALIPTSWWSSSYYTPVSTPNVASNNGDERTVAWLYNPGGSSLSVTYARRNTSGTMTTSTITVPAGGVYKQVLDNATDGTGAHFYSSGATFYAMSTTDAAGTDVAYNQAWDWSFTMIPNTMLSTQALVGLGIGRDPESTVNLDENGNPVWVTTVGNGDTAATVYVDYDADPTTGTMQDASGYWCDASYSLRELEQARVYVPRLKVDATSSGTTGDGTTSATLDVTHTTGTSANRLMLVSVAIANDSTTQRTVSDVTYGGVGLTHVGDVMAAAGGGGDGSQTTMRPRVEIWALADPASGSGTVRVTLSDTKAFVVGVTTFSGVDISSGLISALGTFASASATSGTTQSVNVTTTAGQLVYDAVAAGVNARGNTADPSNFAVGNGQTQQWTQFARSEDGQRDRHVRGAGSTEVAAGTATTMSWTTTTNYPWAIGAVPINSAPSTKIDQTGLLLYTLDSNVKLAVAWGQDPQTSTAGAPGLDVGTSVPPMPEFTAGKDGVLYDSDNNPANGYSGDRDGDGYITCGDEIEWPITVLNISRIPVPDMTVKDEIPSDTTYVAGSTVQWTDEDNNGTYETPHAIADNSSGNPFPLCGSGHNFGTLAAGKSFTVTFRVIIDTFANLTTGTLAIYNDGSAHAFSWTDPVDDRVFLRARVGDRVWWDEDSNGIQDAVEGGIADVTITLFDGSGNPVSDDHGVQIQTVTDTTGSYDFKGLLPGNYQVEFIPPATTLLTTQNVGADDAVDSDPDTTSHRVAVTLHGGEHNDTIDAGVIELSAEPGPTRAEIGSFGAYLSDGRVVVGWSTLSEVGTAGFYVERRESGGWTRVNARLVPALFESPTGGSYAVVDSGASPGETLEYRLVEVEVTGNRIVRGPYQVIAEMTLPEAAVSSQLTANGEQARVAKSPMGEGEHTWQSAGSQARPPKVTQLRVETVDAGLYRVSVADIANGFGVTEAKATDLIRSKGLKLTNGTKTVSYLQAADNSAIFFYGEAVDSIYTPANVYWLTLAKGTVMVASAAKPTSGTPATTFIDTLHSENNYFAYTQAFHDAGADYWLWDYLLAGEPGDDTRDFDIEVPEVVEGGSVTVSLLGMTTVPTSDEHHVQVSLNGTVLGDTHWTGLAAHQAQFDIPEGLLVSGTNTLEVQALLDPAVDYSVVGLESVDVAYERTTAVLDDMMLMTASVRGPVQLSGLSSPDAWVLDISTPWTPKVLKTTPSTGVGGTALTFEARAGGKYLAATAAGAMQPLAITPVAGGQLKPAGANGAEYIVITTPALAGAAGRLADYRATQGLTSWVVTTSAIYDSFSFGVVDPHAIKQFISYALAKLRPKPIYVVLAGDASIDYKDYLGFSGSLVPTLMIDAPEGLVTSDSALGDVNGDSVPEVALGRLPAMTESDLDDMLAKIKAYESAPAGAWQATATVAADNGDDAGDFAADADTLAAAMPKSFTVNRLYLDDLDAAAARSALLGSFTDTLLVDYVGHAGADQWAEEALLSNLDVPGLAAGSTLPVVNALTCLVGQYALPGFDTLSEMLVKRAGAGAIAVWAPTAMEQNDDSIRLGTLFAQKMFGGTNTVALGKAVVASLRAAAAEGLPAWFLQTYALIGDPALKVKW
jgi:uncharacterized repeat protein (TIGR01451 family)